MSVTIHERRNDGNDLLAMSLRLCMLWLMLFSCWVKRVRLASGLVFSSLTKSVPHDYMICSNYPFMLSAHSYKCQTSRSRCVCVAGRALTLFIGQMTRSHPLRARRARGEIFGGDLLPFLGSHDRPRSSWELRGYNFARAMNFLHKHAVATAAGRE